MLGLPSATQPCIHSRHKRQGRHGARSHAASLRLILHAASGEGPTSATDVSSPSNAPASSKEAMLARIAKAKAYKTGGAAAPTAPSPPPASPPPPSPEQQQGPGSQRPAVDWGAIASFIQSPKESQAASQQQRNLSPEERAAEEEAQRERLARFEAAKDKMSETPLPPDSNEDGQFTKIILSARQAPGRGSAAAPADFLRSVLSEEGSTQLGGVDTSSMRMEEITLLKEAAIKQRGVEILSVDSTYRPDVPSDGSSGQIVTTTRNPEAAAKLLGPQARPFTLPPEQEQAQGSTAGASSDSASASSSAAAIEEHKPAVSTWGVFPRPKDISKAFGGGRNLRPGQELESAEQKAAREAAYSAALKAYREKAGLDIDPDTEAEAEKLYDQGMVLFGKADLQGAYDLFDKAAEMVPIKSRVGGLASMQKAIILDSQGYGQQAQKLYRQLQGHAVAQVSRKAKQMLFGFKAAAFLKADTISYGARKGDFDRYFRPLVDRSQIYVASEEDKMADALASRTATLIAVSVLLGPIVMLLVLANRSALTSILG